MVIGEMRNSIVIRKAITTKNDVGEIVNVWAIHTTLRASVKYLGGTKNINNNEIYTSNTLEFVTHYRPSITDQMRIVFKNDTYIINNIQPVGMNEGLKIMAEKLND